MEESKGIDKGWYLGLDFGTSNTYLVGYYSWGDKAAGKFYATELMSEDLRSSDMGIPTAITKEAKQYLIGQQALEKFNENKELKIFRELKIYARCLSPVGDSDSQQTETSKVQVGTEEISAKEALENFFKILFEKANESIEKIPQNEQSGILRPEKITYSTIQNIVIGCPNSEGQEIDTGNVSSPTVHYTSVLQDALSSCFITGLRLLNKRKRKDEMKQKIKVVPEAKLAGITYLCSSKTENDVALVVDCGGGTTDFALVQWKESNEGVRKMESTFIGKGCDRAGNNIDEEIQKGFGKHVSQEGARVSKEFVFKSDSNHPRNESDLIGQHGQYSFSDNEIQCSLSYVPTYGLLGKIGGGNRYKRINEESVYKSIVEALSNQLRNWEKSRQPESKQINTVFFVGGTSFIVPYMRKVCDFVREKQEEGSKIFAEEVRVVTPDGGYPKIQKNHIEFMDNLYNDGKSGWGNASIRFNNTTYMLTCFNAIAIGACIEALGKEVVLYPKIEYLLDGTTWREIYSPEKDGVLTPLLDTEGFVSTGYDYKQIELFYEVHKRNRAPKKLQIRIGGSSEIAIEIPFERIEKINNENRSRSEEQKRYLVISFALAQSGDLNYKIGEGEIVEKDGRKISEIIETFITSRQSFLN